LTQRVSRPIRELGSTGRLIVLGAALAALALIFLIANGSDVRAGAPGSDPYSPPQVVDTNPSKHIVETTIVAEKANIDIGNGLKAHAQTFNGDIPGPTFKLNVGDTVIVHYKNKLPKESGIHWHGIELANEADGTPFTQNQVEPGGTFLYKFKVLRPGLFWYHPHHHSSTNQVFKGLYGMIVVKDPNENKLEKSRVLPKKFHPKVMVLSDTTVCKTQGANDAATYDPGAPWAGGGALPAQAAPTPKNLCEGPGTPGPPANPYPIDENGSLRTPFKKGDIPNIQTALHAGRINEGQTVLTNGINVGGRAGTPSAPGALDSGASTLKVRAGQGLRMQLLNASTVRYMRLRLTSPSGTLIPLVRVGGEGGLLNRAVLEGGLQGTFDTKYDAGEILLPPGSRADVVAAIPDSPASGVATMWTEDYSRSGLGFMDIPTVPVAHFKITGPAFAQPYTITGGSGNSLFPPAGTKLRAATGHPVQTLGPATGSLLDPVADFSPDKLGMASQNIKFTQNGQTDLGVDGVFGTHDVAGDYMLAPHLGSSRYAEQGDTLELTTTNQTSAHHPFHLHGFSIQPLTLTKAASPTYTWLYPEFRDNVDIPAQYTLTFRIKLDPRPMMDGKTTGGALGRWLFHCHIFFHATNGMLSELVIVTPTGNERPNVNVNKSEVSVKRGKKAKVNGTFGDPDGNLVDLKASVGKATETGSGSYKWTYKTKHHEKSKIVYITAKDSNGLKGQIAFQLKVRH
jgi:FtsP/CotA-like multicopper oxidase with cupredoxin domain